MIESHDYHVHVVASGPKVGVIGSSEDELPELEVASPPEFGGPGHTWSPEHLLVAAVSACLMSTFHALVEISGIDVLEYEDEAVGDLQRGEDRLYRIDRVTLRPSVVVENEETAQRAMKLLKKAKSICLISRSVASEIRLEPSVVVAERLSPEG